MTSTSDDLDFPARCLIAGTVRRRVTGSRVAWDHATLRVLVPRHRLARAIGDASSAVREVATELGVAVPSFSVEVDTGRLRA